jgi:hypothetical protein
MADKVVTIGSQPTYELLDEDTMVTNSDRAVPTQQSVKAYVDGALGIGGITATSAEINKLAGLATTKTELGKLAGAGAVVASGTQHAHVADAKANYQALDLDTEAEIITALNTTNGKLNAILAALEAFGINALA